MEVNIHWYDIISAMSLILFVKSIYGEQESSEIGQLFSIIFKVFIMILFIAIWGGIFYW